MNARRAGRCPECKGQISPGDEIYVHLGKWLHMVCKNKAIATKVRAAGPPVEIPYEAPEETTPQVTGIKSVNRKHFRRMRRTS